MRCHPLDCNGWLRPHRGARFGATRSLAVTCGDVMSVFAGLDEYIRQSRPRFEEWLGRLVEIPTVSMDPARRNDMRRGAAVAVEYLTTLGAQATIVESGGHPLVVGGWIGNLAWRPVLGTASRDAHSGLAGGGPRSPLSELAAVVAAWFDAKTGRVAIPGFYKSVRPLGRTDRAQFLKSGFQVKAFAAAHQLTKLRVRDRLEVMKRLWAEPTFEVHGFVGGYTGPGVKTSIPPP